MWRPLLEIVVFLKLRQLSKILYKIRLYIRSKKNVIYYLKDFQNFLSQQKFQFQSNVMLSPVGDCDSQKIWLWLVCGHCRFHNGDLYHGLQKKDQMDEFGCYWWSNTAKECLCGNAEKRPKTWPCLVQEPFYLSLGTKTNLENY